MRTYKLLFLNEAHELLHTEAIPCEDSRTAWEYADSMRGMVAGAVRILITR